MWDRILNMLSYQAPSWVTPKQLQFFLDVAMQASDIARSIVLDGFADPNLSIGLKSDNSWLTAIDGACEQAVRSFLQNKTPEFSVLGEEEGVTPGETDAPCWIVDPIDGTTSFGMGLPLFGTIIALVHQETTWVAVEDLPALDQRFLAVAKAADAKTKTKTETKTKQGWMPDRFDMQGKALPGRLRAQATAVDGEKPLLAGMRIALGDVVQWGGEHSAQSFFELAAHLSTSGAWIRTLPDVLGHGAIYSGAIDAMIDPDLKPWDLAASRLLAPAAGLVWLSRAGCTPGSTDVLMAQPRCVAPLLNALAKWRPDSPWLPLECS